MFVAKARPFMVDPVIPSGRSSALSLHGAKAIGTSLANNNFSATSSACGAKPGISTQPACSHYDYDILDGLWQPCKEYSTICAEAPRHDLHKPSPAMDSSKALDSHLPTHKDCTKCKQSKPLQMFFKDPQKKFGCTSWCKECFAAYGASRKLSNARGPTVSERQCSICKAVKSSTEFIRDSRRATGLDARCKLCRRAQHKARKVSRVAKGVVVLAEKQCRRCKLVKSASEFKRHSYTASGLDSWCKACCSERRREKGKHKVLAPTIDEKQCVRCHTTKPSTEFTRDTGKRTGLGARCRQCENIYRKEKRILKRGGVLDCIAEDPALSPDNFAAEATAAVSNLPDLAFDLVAPFQGSSASMPATYTRVVSTEGPAQPKASPSLKVEELEPDLWAAPEQMMMCAPGPSSTISWMGPPMQHSASDDGLQLAPIKQELMQIEGASCSSHCDSDELDLSHIGLGTLQSWNHGELESFDLLMDDLDGYNLALESGAGHADAAALGTSEPYWPGLCSQDLLSPGAWGR